MNLCKRKWNTFDELRRKAAIIIPVKKIYTHERWDVYIWIYAF